MSRVLIVYWHPESVAMRPAVEQHLRAFERYAARGGVEYLNSFSAPRPPGLHGARYDAILLHTTFLTQRWGDTFGLFKQRFSWLADFPRPKVAVPQDEYDHPYVLDEWLYELGVEDVFTNFAAPERTQLYPVLANRARFHECLTGYIDPETAAAIAEAAVPLRDRPVDVVYRASQLPFWFGRHGQLKHLVGEAAVRAAARLGLKADISMRYEDVIYGDAWFTFLASGKAVVGAESGSSALDRRGEIQTAIRSLLAAAPDMTFDEVDRRLPPGWDGHGLTAISPRHFEAVITRTPQLLVEGAYSGVLERDAHYVSIKSDLSDVDAALGRLSDVDAMEQMSARAYEDIYASGRYTYEAFARQLANVVYLGEPRSPFAVSALGSAARVAETAAGAASVTVRASDRIASFALRATLRATRLRRSRRGGLPVPSSRTRLRLDLARSTLGLLLTNGSLLRLAASAGSGGVSPRAVARDLLRLAVIDRSQRLSAPAPWTCVAELRGESLVLASYPVGTLPPAAEEVVDFREIAWDHSAVGSSVPFRPDRPELGDLAIGTDGVYVFSALSLLARRRPTLAAAALRPYGRGA